jgi:hypothetical protein
MNRGGLLEEHHWQQRRLGLEPGHDVGGDELTVCNKAHYYDQDQTEDQRDEINDRLEKVLAHMLPVAPPPVTPPALQPRVPEARE